MHVARARVRMHPLLNSPNPLAGESQCAYQIWARSVQWLSRYSDGILRGSARGTCGCIPPLTNANSLADWSLCAYQISAQLAVWFSRYGKGIWGRGCTWHVRTCGCVQLLASAHPLVDGSLCMYQIGARFAEWLLRYSKGIYVVFVYVARAHVRKHPVRRNGRPSIAAPLPATGRSTQRNAPSGQSLPTNFKALPLQFMTLGNVVYIIKKYYLSYLCI